MAPKKKAMQVANWLGAPQAHRDVAQILSDISALTPDEQVAALRSAPRSMRALLHFCYARHEIDLPKGPLSYAVIPTGAYVDPADAYHDLLAAEAPRMYKLFIKSANPNLTTERRRQIWNDIQARLPRNERELLDIIRMRREVPGIARETVERAFPGMLDAPRAPEQVQGIEYPPSIMSNPTPIHDRPMPPTTREPTASDEIRYAALMKLHGWDQL